MPANEIPIAKVIEAFGSACDEIVAEVRDSIEAALADSLDPEEVGSILVTVDRLLGESTADAKREFAEKLRRRVAESGG